MTKTHKPSNTATHAETAYAVVELEQESNGEKTLADTRLFRDRAAALEYLHRQYLKARESADSGAGEFSEDYSEDGWYAVVDNDGDLKEGYLSEEIPIK